MSALTNSETNSYSLASKSEKHSKENIFALIFILVFGFILSMPSEFFPLSDRFPSCDLSIYQYIGRLLNEGGFPYVDAFDHKGPLLYVLYAIGDKINQSHGMWVINYIFVSGTLGFSYFTARKFLDFKFSSLLCFIIYSDILYMDDYAAGTPEFYAGFFISVCIWILTDYYKLGDISNKKVLILGLSVGFAFWLKHLTVSTILILCFFIICDCIAHKDYKKIRRYLLLFIVGFAIPSVLVCIWLMANNAFGAMIEDYFLYNFLYGGNSKMSFLDRMSAFRFITNRFSTIAALNSVILFFIAWLLNSDKETKYSLKLIIHSSFALALTIMLLSLPGNNFPHYNATLFSLEVLIASCALEYIQDLNFEKIKIPKIKSKAMCIVVLVLCILLYIILFDKNVLASLSFIFLMAYFILGKIPASAYKNIKKLKTASLILSLSVAVCTVAVILPKQCKDFWTPLSYETEIVDTINTYAKPDDTIIIYGFYSYGVYSGSGHHAASKYIYSFIVDYSSEQQDEYITEYRSDIKKNRPAAIVCRSYIDPYSVFGDEILSDYSLVLEDRGGENPYNVYILNERINALSDT